MSHALFSILGMAVLLLLAFGFSTNRRAINYRVIGSAFCMQALISAGVLFTEPGAAVLRALSNGVLSLLGYANVGIDMVFGGLVTDNVGFSFALNVLPIIIFFSALMSVLYHLRIMQPIVIGGGVVLEVLLGTKPVESLNAVANIFVSQTEAPLTLRPYLGSASPSQIFAIMVSGMASVSGTVLAAYAQMGVNVEYLIAASFMSAPGGLLMAKIFMPETSNTDDVPEEITVGGETQEHVNVILAAASGAQDGLKIAVSVAAMLIAFVSLIAFANGILEWLGQTAGVDGVSLQVIFGYVFAPLMFLLGVPWEEALTGGAIFGEKLVLNEFIAFNSLSEISDSLSERTVIILTFALCGFANFGSIAILLGGLGSLLPDRVGFIAKMGLKAVLAASFANLMSAALAGLFFGLN